MNIVIWTIEIQAEITSSKNVSCSIPFQKNITYLAFDICETEPRQEYSSATSNVEMTDLSKL